MISLDELKACASAPGGGEDAVRAFLLESREMPTATLRWPAWRLKVVPDIMAQLSGVDVVEEKVKEALEVVGRDAVGKENAPGGGVTLGPLSPNSGKRKRRSYAKGANHGAENEVPHDTSAATTLACS